ncbi:MAG: DNA/RNA nuclease SfsA [Colwellia sp.]
MKFDQPLIKATLIKRYKRFLADVTLEDGSITTVYCSNTGAMTGCATPGDTVWLLPNDDPKRKYRLSWEITQTQANHFICVNTARANQLTEMAINDGTIKELQGYKSLKREVKYGDENSKIDFFLSDEHKADCYVEVKSCTLLDENLNESPVEGQGYFPDTTTVRGQKHLRELIHMKQLGFRSVLLFAVLHTGIKSVKAASHIDKKYGELFNEAKAQGVEIYAYLADISTENMFLNEKIL